MHGSVQYQHRLLATLTIINIARFHTYSINHITQPLGDRQIPSYILPRVITNYKQCISRLVCTHIVHMAWADPLDN